MFQYFKCQIVNNGFTVLKETHFSEETVNGWRDDFKGEVFFSQGSTSSSGVTIDYLGNKKFLVNKTRKYNNGRLLIIEAKMEAEIFILLNSIIPIQKQNNYKHLAMLIYFYLTFP